MSICRIQLIVVDATCIPTISSELQSADRYAWIGTAYLWSNVTFTPLYGRLSDLIGRRAAYLQALLLFTIGTLFCGLAPTFTTLTAARFVAGMGGGGMGTVSSVLIADLFPPEDRGFYQGLTFATFGAGIGLGGPIGGVLTQYFGWRAAFYSETTVDDSDDSPSTHCSSVHSLGGHRSTPVHLGGIQQRVPQASGFRRIRHSPTSRETVTRHR